MDTKMFALNITLAIVDTVVAALAIIAFGWGSWYFDKWWILLLTIIPLALFNTHTLVLDIVEKEDEKDEN